MPGTIFSAKAKPGPRSPSKFIISLVKGNVLTSEQATLLEAIWPKLDADTFAHPGLCSVPEHTRVFLEHAAARKGR